MRPYMDSLEGWHWFRETLFLTSPSKRKLSKPSIPFFSAGAFAQLVERVASRKEVVGSILDQAAPPTFDWAGVSIV